jgi:mannose-6-phosphate isomerase-like protein (cupin superfamily)
VVEGRMKLALRVKKFELNEGEMIVVPKSVEHRPVCEEVCTVMLIEPNTTINTGNAGGVLTDTEIEWI